MFELPSFIAGLVASYIVWTLLCLFQNYRRAKSMNIPLIIIPIDFLNVSWQVIESHIWSLIDFLQHSLNIPIPLPRCAQYMRRGWHFADKSKTHEELGRVYAFVTPRMIYVAAADGGPGGVIDQVLSKRTDFPRPAENYDILKVYGPSLSSARPEDWPRHRKALAPPFMNEKVMESVWDESVRQARQMVSAWTSSGIGSVAADTRTLSLNVLAAIGFRKSFDFKPREQEPVLENGKYSYRDALQMVLDHVILLLLVPRKYLIYSWLPAWVRRLGKAANDFQTHMQEMVDEELSMLNNGGKGSGSLITSLVKALDVHQKDKRQGIAVEEIFGNLFIVNFAGHDTTANTLAFSMLLLAAHPEVQEWVAEEIRSVIGEAKGEKMEYAATFPRLLRCRAVMLETLRLFTPIMSLPKGTSPQPQTIKFEGREITIPAGCAVMSSILAVHTLPQYWPDPLTWKPTRWILTNSANTETLYAPPKDTYLPWSDGPQNCPGIKFSQVEFVAVLACMFGAHRIRPIAKDGETEKQTRKRVADVANDCEAMMLLKMRDPDRVQMRFERMWPDEV